MESEVPKYIKLSKEANAASVNRICAFIRENQIKEASIEVHSSYTCENLKEVMKTKIYQVIVKLPLAEKAKANELNKKIQADPDLEREIEIDCKIRLNEQFQSIEGVGRLGGAGEECTIAHKQGTVLAVFFWSSRSKICEELMAQKQQMIQENEPKWKDKVRIATANLDGDEKDLEKIVDENRWSHFDHYTLPKEWRGSNEFPLLILVDQKGKVVFANHPSNTNLEEDIHNLLEAPISNESKDLIEEKENERSLNSYKKLRELIKNGSCDSVLKLRRGHHLTLSLQHCKKYDKDFNLIEENRGALFVDGAMGAVDAANVAAKLAEVTEAIPSDYVLDRIVILPTIELPLSEKCNSCSKSLGSDDPQYLNYQDKVHFCKPCSDIENLTPIESQSPSKGQSLIEIRSTSLVNEVFAHKLKGQRYPKSPEEIDQLKLHQGIRCDSCGEGVGTKLRYNCLNCLNIDICGFCHEKIEKGDTSLQEKLESRGHHCQTHVLQRSQFCEEL